MEHASSQEWQFVQFSGAITKTPIVCPAAVFQTGPPIFY